MFVSTAELEDLFISCFKEVAMDEELRSDHAMLALSWLKTERLANYAASYQMAEVLFWLGSYKQRMSERAKMDLTCWRTLNFVILWSRKPRAGHSRFEAWSEIEITRCSVNSSFAKVSIDSQ